MRVFLDTNVLASAFGTRGLCADVLREVLVAHDLLVSDVLFQELERVLLQKFQIPSSVRSEILSLLKQDLVYCQVGALSVVPIKDQDDLPILSCAPEGQAEVFVTGDKELLALEHIGTLLILSPRAFWEHLKGS
ncbi:MAG: putative toxin-antitoxin system toxin component, PIN family [Nitrospirales bacterium]|nr:putative toxin-antitoxin system toxin component, PIN family [Nitrospirales bacterium]